MFKDGWEEGTRPLPNQDTVRKIIGILCPNKTLEVCALLKGGLSHWHYKIILNSQPFVLRLHDRQNHTSLMEASLSLRIKTLLPVPQVLQTLYIDPFWCSLVTFEEGISLRTLLLNPAERRDLYDLSCQAGNLLLDLQKDTYLYPGFFDEKACLATPFHSPELISHGLMCLQSDFVQEHLPLKHQDHLQHLLKNEGDLLTISHGAHLVHGDFDPSNIFVRLENEKWKISALMDWEYAHAGTYLQDTANWLRWRHHMPIDYMAGFVDVLQEKGHLTTDADWRTTSFLDALALLDLLHRTRPHEPIRTTSLCALIEERLQDL